MSNTRDLSSFGYRELDIAGDLLKAMASNKNKTEFLGDDVNLEFNPISGNVFLVDCDYNVAMMNGDNLEDFFICSNCGHEGFKEDIKHNLKDNNCIEYLESIGII